MKKSNNLYIALIDYDKFTKDIRDVKIKEEKLINKCNKSGFNERTKTLAAKKQKNKNKIKALTSKTELKAGKDEIVKPPAFD